VQIERDFKVANEERNLLKDEIAKANLKVEISQSKDKQLNDLITNVKNNASEEIKR
jgi:hypothetical protein